MKKEFKSPGPVCFKTKFSSLNLRPYMDLPPVPSWFVKSPPWHIFDLWLSRFHTQKVTCSLINTITFGNMHFLKQSNPWFWPRDCPPPQRTKWTNHNNVDKFCEKVQKIGLSKLTIQDYWLNVSLHVRPRSWDYIIKLELLMIRMQNYRNDNDCFTEHCFNWHEQHFEQNKLTNEIL